MFKSSLKFDPDVVISLVLMSTVSVTVLDDIIDVISHAASCARPTFSKDSVINVGKTFNAIRSVSFRGGWHKLPMRISCSRCLRSRGPLWFISDSPRMLTVVEGREYQIRLNESIKSYRASRLIQNWLTCKLFFDQLYGGLLVLLAAKFPSHLRAWLFKRALVRVCFSGFVIKPWYRFSCATGEQLSL